MNHFLFFSSTASKRVAFGKIKMKLKSSLTGVLSFKFKWMESGRQPYCAISDVFIRIFRKTCIRAEELGAETFHRRAIISTRVRSQSLIKKTKLLYRCRGVNGLILPFLFPVLNFFKQTVAVALCVELGRGSRFFRQIKKINGLPATTA